MALDFNARKCTSSRKALELCFLQSTTLTPIKSKKRAKNDVINEPRSCHLSPRYVNKYETVVLIALVIYYTHSFIFFPLEKVRKYVEGDNDGIQMALDSKLCG